MQKQQMQFQAEVQQVLDLMIHSVYSNKEIFLRELISNASDAIDKRKFLGLTDNNIASPDGQYFIRLEPDSNKRTLKIIDNGIGMSYEELVENIGTIARSGTKKFTQMAKELKANPELIGQFGVGFYSAFMVADKISLHTRKAGSEQGYYWESSGGGAYSLEERAKDSAGTEITLYLKAEEVVEHTNEEEHNDHNYVNEWTIKRLVSKYSDFIAHPIMMKSVREEPVRDSENKIVEGQFETKVIDETLNSRKALWTRSPSELKIEDYNEFYFQIANDWNPPQKHIHYKAEGNVEFNSILYIPSKRPYNFNTIEAKKGLSLYVKRVFIMNDCEDLLAPYLRFTKGIVDSSDLSLNISREILQQDKQVQIIRKSITTKILNTLSDLQKNNADEYIKFWNNFGMILKEGIASDYDNHKKLSELMMFHSTNSNDSMTTLTDYVERMKTEQTEIYYLAGENLEQLRSSPHLEIFKDKNYEVLLMNEDIDEWVVNHLGLFKEKKLKSVTASDLKIDESNTETQKELDNLSLDFKDIIDCMKDALKEEIKEVRVSKRLKDSPVCLVDDENDMSANMQRIIAAHRGEAPKIKRILEINPKHAVFGKMKSAGKEEQKDWAELFYGQALLTEGAQLKDPVKFSKQLNKFLLQ